MSEGPTKPKSMGKALHQQWVATVTGAKIHGDDKLRMSRLKPVALKGKKGKKA